MPQATGDSHHYTIKTVGALPLLRSFLQRVGFASLIDGILPKDPQAYLSVGQVAEVLVANRLSSPQPLYRVEEWAERAGVQQVFGIPPDWLNDDRLGRVLDSLAEKAKGLKGDLCLAWAQGFGIELKRFHYDLTTVWLQGEYEEEEPDAIRIQYTKDNSWEAAGKGYRLGVSTFDDGRGEVSLAYQPLDGTEHTAAAAIQNMKELKKVFGSRVDPVLQVTDRAGVTAEVVATAALEGFRVLGPLAMSASLKDLLQKALANNPPWQELSYLSERQAKKPAEQRDRYRAFERPYEFEYEEKKEAKEKKEKEKKKAKKKYAARLLVVSSDGKRKRDQKTREKHQQRIERQLTDLAARGKPRRGQAPNLLRNVSRILSRYNREGKFYEVTWEGSPEAPTGFVWSRVEERVREAQAMEGIYAVATTLEPSHSLDEIFTQLKQQWRVEDSHRILKGPLRISPVFLHSPKRIEGLIFVLWLALVAYQLLEREWREKAPDEKARRWTTLKLLRLFEGYGYVGVQEAHSVRWVASVLPMAQRLVYSALDLPRPDTS